MKTPLSRRPAVLFSFKARCQSLNKKNITERPAKAHPSRNFASSHAHPQELGFSYPSFFIKQLGHNLPPTTTHAMPLRSTREPLFGGASSARPRTRFRSPNHHCIPKSRLLINHSPRFHQTPGHNPLQNNRVVALS